MTDWQELPENSLITIDTAPIIYFLENHPVFAEKFYQLFERLDQGSLNAVISPITLSEVVSGPLKVGR